MDLKELMSWPWGKGGDSGARPAEEAFRALQADINRAFEMFWQQLPQPRLRAGFDVTLNSDVRVDVCETDAEIEITLELPGVTEADIEVGLFERLLIVTAEKKPEHGMEGRSYRINERTFGRVSRSLPLPENADAAGIEAVYRNGVLKITMPRIEASPRDVRKIDVKAV
jgi:HSP20 family protein